MKKKGDTMVLWCDSICSGGAGVTWGKVKSNGLGMPEDQERYLFPFLPSMRENVGENKSAFERAEGKQEFSVSCQVKDRSRKRIHSKKTFRI